MAESQGNNNADEAVGMVTIAEAADLLGCHPNTVRSRVKAGMYRAEKMHTENGPTWMIERDSLTTNAPTSAPQQGVVGVPAIQQEAIQELARAFVRESGIAQDSEWQARLEGNKLAAEAAKTLVLVGSGLLVGMAAVVGIMPVESRTSPLLYLAFALVLIAIFGGFGWLRHIASVTSRGEGDALGGPGIPSMVCFVFGVGGFILYVLLYSPAGVPETPREQVIWAAGALLGGVLAAIGYFAAVRWYRRRSEEG